VTPSFYLLPIQFMDVFLFFPQNFRNPSTLADSKFFTKIVVINSLGGATIIYVAYTSFYTMLDFVLLAVFPRTFVKFVNFMVFLLLVLANVFTILLLFVLFFGMFSVTQVRFS